MATAKDVQNYQEDDRPASRRVLRVENFTGTLDAYCIECKSQSVFQRSDKKAAVPWIGEGPSEYEQIQRARRNIQNRTFCAEFVCTRNNMHKMHFYFQIHNHTLLKAGQYPSLVDLIDLTLHEVSKYRSILDVRVTPLVYQLEP